MVRVVIAEKPSVARDIAKVLGATQRHDGYIDGNGYAITWAIGHLVHLFEPDDYGGLWKGRWSLKQLPMIPEEWRLKTHPNTKKQLDIVTRLINDHTTEEVICATDAGREGEHIFRLIYQFTQCQKPFKRLWISSLTDEAIEQGFGNLHPGQDFDNLAAAARARAQADWLIGMNMTRAYTVHNGALCTIGRVQTPTLAMIVTREELITVFKKAYFYEISATLAEGFQAKYQNKQGKTRIDVKQEAERLHARLLPHTTGTITKVEKKIKKHKPPMLFDLITLQKEANKRFGMTAAMVLEHAQALYERYKLITYPRTESQHISEDMVPQLPQTLACLNHPLAPMALERLRAGHKLGKAYVDKTKLSDHHGILPTPRRPPANLPDPLQKVYELIVARFVAIFLPDHVVEETFVWLKIGGEFFRARGTVVLEEGWKVIERRKPGAKTEEQKIPELTKGQTVNVTAMELLERETAPPKPYTDATLLAAMKNAGREVEDEALAKAMKESGLGTPATRAEIIEKLVRTKLIERRKKSIHPTRKGMALIGIVAGPLKSPELTGEWEQKLKDIEEGRMARQAYDDSIVGMVTGLLPEVTKKPPGAMKEFSKWAEKRREDAKAQESKATTRPRKPSKTSSLAQGNCPKCGQGTVIEGKGAWGCNRFRAGCQFRIPKQIAGKVLTAKQVADLAGKRKTTKLKGFQGKSGAKFEARLILDENLDVKFDKDSAVVSKEQKPKTMHCPRCGKGTVIEGKRGFGCDRFREGCHFVIWKEIAGKKISATQVQRLVNKGSTTLLKGFTNPQGNRFNACIRLNSNWEPEFEIADS